MDNYSTIRAPMQAIKNASAAEFRKGLRIVRQGMVLVLRVVWAGEREWKRENLGAKGSGFLGFARNDMAVANIKDREPVPVLGDAFRARHRTVPCLKRIDQNLELNPIIFVGISSRIASIMHWSSNN